MIPLSQRHELINDMRQLLLISKHCFSRAENSSSLKFTEFTGRPGEVSKLTGLEGVGSKNITDLKVTFTLANFSRFLTQLMAFISYLKA